MDVTEKWGDSVEAAVKLALEELDATRDDVDVEVLEQPSKGFFGIGSKLALVRVSTKQPEKTVEPESTQSRPVRPEKAPIKAPEYTPTFTEKSRERRERGGVRNEHRQHHQREKRDYDKIIEESGPVVPVVDSATLTDIQGENPAATFLEGLVREMGLDLQVSGKTDGKDFYFYLDGKDSGTVIGKRGITLDAIQYLTSLVINRDGGEYVRVVVDAENYRAKRGKSLEKLALRLADKVVRSRRSFRLEPMNPYERKIIHATLQKDDRVTTRSEGLDPYRRVIIELK